ncbi:MAG: hypothetical protein OER91_06690 [Gammaproteobacteria bacterium]|nr:hypothetical protein [Gammaproteobacteria bacterium]
MPAHLTFEAATDATEPQLRKLLRDNPVGGNIQVCLEREPNAFYAAGISGDEYQMMLALGGDPCHVIGSGGRFELLTYVNGHEQRVGYFGELRAEGGLRTRRKLLLGSYQTMRRFHEAGNVPYYMTTIIEDNHAARRLLEAGLADMPTYRPLEKIVTFTIPARSGARRHRRSQHIVSGSERSIPRIAGMLQEHGTRYQFYPKWGADTLRSEIRCRGLSPGDFLLSEDRDSQVRGSLALWDQRAFKQTVIHGYSRQLGRARPLINLLAPMLRRPRLPAPGARLESAFLSHVAVAEEDGDTLEALISCSCRRAMERNIDYVMISFAERHPLTAVVRKRFPCHSYVSVLYVVYWEDGAPAAESLDDRIPHPEVAIL